MLGLRDQSAFDPVGPDWALNQLVRPLGRGLYHNPFPRLGISIGDKGIRFDRFCAGLSHGNKRETRHHNFYPISLAAQPP